MHVVVTKSANVTKAEFSRMAKVSRAAVSIALRKGRITAERDGSMNPKRPENAAYITTRKRQRRQKSPGPGGRKGAPAKLKPSRSERGQKTTKGKPKQHVARSAGGRKTKRAKIAESGPQKGALQIDGETFNMADLRHTIAKADKAEQEIAIRRGELVERTDVHRVFARLYQVHTSQLKTLADKEGSNVAAAFGLTDPVAVLKVQQVMSENMRRALSQIKQELNEYLESIGNGGMEDERDTVPLGESKRHRGANPRPSAAGVRAHRNRGKPAKKKARRGRH
ncbi:MAG: hypothetical protein IMZ69_01270 [Spirochaetes bacterium]|nr:hypothetical protein [Spirochaetota bacterium]